MQDRYVGDEGDFAKYALLKALVSGDKRLRLGVLWYAFPDETHNADGRHIGYLTNTTIAQRDPAIHAQLGKIVAENCRSLSAVEAAGILPEQTLFYQAPVAAIGKPVDRRAHRTRWFLLAAQHVESADIVFFDPDNGIETPALKRSDFKAGKYVFWSELRSIWDAGKSLIVYNHLNRSASAAVQESRLRAQFAEHIPEAAALISLLFRRGSCRHFWVIAQPAHRDVLMERVRRFLQCGWLSTAGNASIAGDIGGLDTQA
jgi:hypothetical protein